MKILNDDQDKLNGHIQSVLGRISPEKLGVTLTHEHFLIDVSAWFKEPKEGTAREMAYSPITMDMLWWIRGWHSHLNNMMLYDEQLAIKEGLRFKYAGGDSVVELTPINVGRDPLALTRISRATGLNIIMGSSYYVDASMGPEMDAKSEEEITEEIVKDINYGVGDTKVCAGIIGEIGCSWPLTKNEMKSLRASARAQSLTGAPLNIHPGHHEDSPGEIIRILDEAGSDISRVVMSHIDRTVRKPENRSQLAKTGCYLEYDLFGREGYYPPERRIIDLPNDHYRLNEISQLIDDGYLKQILISQDVCNKGQLCTYGGWGYDHILRDVVPVMRLKGFSEEVIHTILVENPKQLLVFA